MRNETELGRLAKSYMDRGELVPDEVTIQMMSRRLMSPEIRDKGFVLDGFPRTVAQVEALDRLLTSLDVSLDRVVSIEVPDEVVVERISGRLSCINCGAIFHRTANPPKTEGRCDNCGGELVQRPDDRPETVRERLRVFHETTAPVIAFYKLRGNLVRIDGSGTRDEVHHAIMKGIPA